MRLKRAEEGQTLVLTAICMTMITGFVGLGVDVGLLFHAKRNLQIAADAAATAAALDYHYNGSVTSAQAAGQAAATANGVTNGTGGAVVTINCPPASGPNVGDGSTCKGFTEALVSEPAQTFFMGAFGFGSVQVSARGVAGPQAGGGCVYAVNPSGSGIQETGGSSNINVPTCKVYDDASLSLSGGSYVDGKAIYVVGSTSLSGGSTTSPAPTTISSFSDPLAFVQAPTIPGSCTNVINNTSGTYSQGCYSSITVSGGDTVILNPGTYIVNGNLTIQGGTITGTGVTFYVTGQVKFQGTSSSTNLTAPLTGEYKGILFFQSRTDTQQFSFTGGSGGTIEGIMYVPDAQLLFSGGSVGTLEADLIGGSLDITGGSALGNYNLANPDNPLSTMVLVE